MCVCFSLCNATTSWAELGKADLHRIESRNGEGSVRAFFEAPPSKAASMQSFRITGERVIATVKTAPAQSPGRLFPSRIGAREKTSTSSVPVFIFFFDSGGRLCGHQEVIATVWGVT